MHPPSHSLRSRLLWPLVAVSIVASIAVAMGSYWLALKTAERELSDRYRSIADTLENNSFPLTRNVLRSIAKLTETELITAQLDGTFLESTFNQGDPTGLIAIVNHARLEAVQGELIHADYAGVRYRAATFRRESILGGGQVSPSAAWVIVLFDEADLSAALARAVIAPLVTGLSTIALLTAITLVLTSRLVRRLSRLQNQVERIAKGEFEINVIPGPPDEVGLLATAVSSMASQLKRMWHSLHQREGERLLHQVAVGLAHNLRNRLTGARMAIELHCKHYAAQEVEGLHIALHEIKQTENYVQRLLLVAAGKQQVDRPARIIECLNDVKSSLAMTAKHRNTVLTWNHNSTICDSEVQDGPSLVAAVTNLIFNAIQVAKHIEIKSSVSSDRRLTIEVIDDGPGPSPEVQETLFDPFVTTKAEGLGLGLPLVRRAARRLGGDIQWLRTDKRTVFRLEVAVTELEHFAKPSDGLTYRGLTSEQSGG